MKQEWSREAVETQQKAKEMLRDEKVQRFALSATLTLSAGKWIRA